MEIKRNKKIDKRVYTFMLVPHRGKTTYSLSLPMVVIKRCLAGLAVIFLLVGCWQLKNMLVVWQARAEQQELAELRATKDLQDEKIQKLAQITETMQSEMGKLTQLENEVRRSLNAEDTGVSRSGIAREISAVLSPQTYQEAVPDIDNLTMRVVKLNDVIVQKQTVFTSLHEQLAERNAIRAATPSIWPASGEITSRFGGRSSPDGIGSNAHQGLDIAGAYGSPVRVTATGVVEIASSYYGYGLYVLVNHGYGMKTAYGHNSALAVNVGQHVKKGQVIAYMGNTGVSTGTHVHYEIIKNGVPVNPANFLY